MKLILFLLLFSQLALAAPKQVLILRHAEKIEGTNNLSPKGYKRAEALAHFFGEKPIAIYASYKAGSSVRSIETMMPTAKHYQVQINTDFRKDEAREMVKEVLNNKDYDGETVIICWQHSNILKILEAFRSEFVPEEWPDSVYDQVIVLSGFKNETRYEVIPQKLLRGDRVFVSELSKQ